jgi:type VI secretion system protein ImpG
MPLVPYYAFGQAMERAAGGQWVARREPAGRPGMGGTDIYLSFADLDQRLSKVRLVSASTLCTNRELASTIRPDLPGAGTFRVPDGAGVLPVRCLYQPTRQHAPPLDGAQLWRLVALLNLNQVTLERLSAEPEADSLQSLRRLLELCNRTASAGAASQIRALTRVRCVAVARPVRSGPAPGFRRGFEIELDVAPDAAYADGTPLMLAAVLQRFFCLYTPVNSFASVTVKRGELKVKEWAPATAH